MSKLLNAFAVSRNGATAVEYGLIAALIAVSAITAMQGMGNQFQTTFNTASSAMSAGNTL